MKIGDKVKLLRKQQNLTMQELADKARLSKGYISMLEKNKNPNSGKPIVPSLETVQNIAVAFNIELDDFLNDVDGTVSLPKIDTPDITTIYNQLTPPRQTKVYEFAEYQLDEQNDNQSINEESVIYLRSSNQSAAGMMIDPDNTEEYDVLPSEIVPHGADEIVEITGRSMEPLIMKGEKVFLRHQPTVENGEIAIVRIENEGVTCKKFYLNGDTIILKSENEEYEDMLFDPSQVTVLGKVLK